MLRKIVRTSLLIGLILSACTQIEDAKNQMDVQDVEQIESVTPSQGIVLNGEVVTPDVMPELIDDPLSSLRGKMVKDKEGYLLLLGFVNAPNTEINFQFPERYQFPHEHAKVDFRILDVNGTDLEFEEVDPGELNLFVENPLGEGIIDPRAFRILQEKAQGPLTLEMINLIQVVNLAEQSELSFEIQFDDSFPLGKNKWDIDQTIDLIPDHSFTVKYFDATEFNDYSQGKYSGPQSTVFNGTYFLEAAGFEGITLSQIVPASRQKEWPMGWGGYEEACTELFTDCIMSGVGLLKTEDNVYQLKIMAYDLIVHGPWQVQFDLPK